MDEIKVELINEVDELSIDFSNIAQTPILAFRKYFHASDDVWEDYLDRHDLNIKFEEFKYLKDLNIYIDTFIKDINEAIIEDISHFDIRLSGGMNKKLLNDKLEISDWEVVIYNISQLNSHDRDKLKTHFFQINTPSIFDFREFIGDNLVFTQCRKAIANRDNQLKILRSKKNSYYPNSTTKDIRGCNFITATQTLDMLSYISVNSTLSYNRNGIETKQTKEEILSKEKSFYRKIEDDNKQYNSNEASKILNELRSIQEINKEIKEDKNKNRGSLEPDSLNKEINSSDIQSPTLAPTTELTTSQEILQEFENEKSFLLIKKQKKDEFLYSQAIEIQDDAIHLAHKLLSDGQTFRQINNILNQKFAQNPFVVEIINLHFSKQLKLSKVKDNQIQDLEEYIQEIQINIQQIENKLKSKEEENSKIRSTLQTKEIEHRKQIDTITQELKEQVETTQEAIDTLEEINKYKEDMDNVVIQLDNENSVLKDKINQANTKLQELQNIEENSKILEEEVKDLSLKLLRVNEKMVELLNK
jgi:hypothetical protein